MLSGGETKENTTYRVFFFLSDTIWVWCREYLPTSATRANEQSHYKTHGPRSCQLREAKREMKGTCVPSHYIYTTFNLNPSTHQPDISRQPGSLYLRSDNPLGEIYSREMTLKLKPRSSLPPFTFSPSPPPPPTQLNTTATPDGPRPPTDFFQERDMHMFGAWPLGDRTEAGRGLVRCKKCERVFMEAAAVEHMRMYPLT